MKNKTIATLLTIATLAASSAVAAEALQDMNGWINSHMAYQRGQGTMFSSRELSLDLFGSYLNPERNIEHLFDSSARHGKWGGGVGLNYFITQFIGIGGDINLPANGRKLIDSLDGNLIARWPIPSLGIAPYIFGGGGRGFDPSWEWFGDAGVGLEARISPVTGFFIDGRYMWPETSADKLLLRAGIRVVF